MIILILAFYVGLKECGLCLAALSCAKSAGKVLWTWGLPDFLLQKLFPNAAISKAAPAPVKPVRPVMQTSSELSRQSLELELGLRISQKEVNPRDCGFTLLAFLRVFHTVLSFPIASFNFIVQRSVAES